MKIFALYLCLELDLAKPEGSQNQEPMSFEKWRKIWRSAWKEPEKERFIWVDDSPDLPERLWDLQAHGDWRKTEAHIKFLFSDSQRLERVKADFRTRFKEKIAAGGIVQNEAGNFLCIQSRGKWTFPKGHWEVGERIEETAVREVQEETGLEQLSIIRPLPTTFHTFKGKKSWKLKTTYWYLMSGSEKEVLLPQSEEGIMAVEWKSKQEVQNLYTQFYPLNTWLFEQINPPNSTLSPI